MKKIILAVLALMMLAQAYAQSPWTVHAGGGYLQLNTTYTPEYNKLFNGSTSLDTLKARLSQLTYNAYMELGLTSKWTLIGNVPIHHIFEKDAYNNSHYLLAPGNVQFTVKRQLLRSLIDASVQMMVELPTSGIDSIRNIRTGYRTWTFFPMLSVGKGFTGFYFYAYGGPILRTDDHSHELNVGGEVGLKLFNCLWLIGRVDAVKSVGNGKIHLYDYNPFRLYPDDQEWFTYGGKAILEISQYFGLNFAAYGNLSGKYVPDVPTYQGGLWVKW